MSTKSFYIPNLNGLRFLAAFAVIVGHLEMCKSSLGIEHLLDSGIGFFEHGGGHLGVVLFFVLSGFLITLLLLKEKEKYKTIAYKKFILRRALRIWPVYFVFITIVIFFVHGIDFILEEKVNGGTLVTMYYLILPNLAMSGFGSIKFIPHLWSIGVEEQFYLIWPLLIKHLNKRWIIVVMILLIFTIPIIPHLTDFLKIRFPEYESILKTVGKFFQYFLINAMAVGGVLAFVFNKYGEWFRERLPKWASIVIVIACLSPWLLGANFGFLNEFISLLLFGTLIFVTSASKPLFLLENKVISYLGKISYGLYVYHWLVSYYIIYLINSKFGEVNYFIYLLGSMLGTVLVASFSYEILEKRFLKFKSKFTLIKSGKV